ncbi:MULTISPECIES: hypothetical protein [Pseudomonas]|uniref:hypothetical protein n=1 Tax=Pseudomonas TaxID=286 RepID=UPI000A7FD46E|nr:MULTISPECIES: hypothetical protein [Pseudomonas]ELS0925527.1 hypothetical protein [Pseudomonas putida]MBH3383916.1 hypothetical protein [Pseudomonas juntendi]MCE0989315.1 hypothetical protein [Pseudomonas alloputida]MDD2116759.1 hypothetical protein [Pseudomonas putida]MDO1495756.1 hypothetical protein [Pseudomonas putida]
MALSDLSVENTIVVITGVGVLDDWGRTDPPFTVEPIDDQAILSRGLGGNAVRFHRKNPGLRLTVNLMPGSPQALALQAQVNAKSEVSGSYASIAGLEGAVFSEGVITRGKSMARGGPGMNDATFVMEFNKDKVV